MKDRIPGRPGRVLVTPENGNSPFYAIVTRADEPIEQGTPLNKANLLSDETAAAYGLGENATPNDVFMALKDGAGGPVIASCDLVGPYGPVNSTATMAKAWFVASKGSIDMFATNVQTPSSGNQMTLTGTIPGEIMSIIEDTMSLVGATTGVYASVSHSSGTGMTGTTRSCVISSSGNTITVSVVLGSSTGSMENPLGYQKFGLTFR